MNTQCSFRFRSGTGLWLVEEIQRIEALATERLRCGVSDSSVRIGALALLQAAVQDVRGEVLAACATGRESAPYPPSEEIQS